MYIQHDREMHKLLSKEQAYCLLYADQYSLLWLGVK